MLNQIDIIGHVGYFCLWYGNLMIARMNLAGWIWRFLGETIWTIIGWYLGLTSIWMWGIVFLGTDAIGYYRWKHEQTSIKKS